MTDPQWGKAVTEEDNSLSWDLSNPLLCRWKGCGHRAGHQPGTVTQVRAVPLCPLPAGISPHPFPAILRWRGFTSWWNLAHMGAHPGGMFSQWWPRPGPDPYEPLDALGSWRVPLWLWHMACVTVLWAPFCRRQKQDAISLARGINCHPLLSAITLFLCECHWPLNNEVGHPPRSVENPWTTFDFTWVLRMVGFHPQINQLHIENSSHHGWESAAVKGKILIQPAAGWLTPPMWDPQIGRADCIYWKSISVYVKHVVQTWLFKDQGHILRPGQRGCWGEAHRPVQGSTPSTQLAKLNCSIKKYCGMGAPMSLVSTKRGHLWLDSSTHLTFFVHFKINFLQIKFWS